MTKAVTLAELADQNVLTATDNKVGIATTNPQSTLQVGAGITMDGNAGVITAQTYYGDGSQLTGIGVDATAISDSNGTVRVQATTSGADITGNLNVSGVLTYEDVTNIDAVGIITANSGIEVAGIVTAKPGAAVTYYGDGSQLSGISVDSTSLVDSNSATRVQANTSGAVITGIVTATNVSTSSSVTAGSFYGDGSALTFAPKVIAFDPAALSTGAAVDTNITITFDQDIKFYGTGTVELRSTSASGTGIGTFAITSGTPDSELSISGTQLIINPTNNLPENTPIYVILPTNGISNLSNTYYAGSNNYNFRTVAQSFSAQGGIEYTLVDGNSPLGSYRYHIFTGPGILTTTSPADSSPSLQLLAIGGGGGGGLRYPTGGAHPQQGGGGGGAGGYITHTHNTLSLASGTYTVTIGAGGTGGNFIPQTGVGVAREGEDGGDTTITPPASPTTYLLRAYGGGGGGGYYFGLTSYGDGVGRPGGSGGGGEAPIEVNPASPTSGGNSVAGQGYPGSLGVPVYPFDPGEDGRSSGGGGGAGGSGSDGSRPNRFWGTTVGAPYPYVVGGTGGPGSPNPFFASPYLTNSGLPADKLSAIGAGGWYGAGGGGVGVGGGLSHGGKGGTGGGGNGANVSAMPAALSVSNSKPSNISPSPYPSGTQPPQWCDGTGVGCGGGGGYHSFPAGAGTDGAIMIRYAVPPV